MQIPSFTAVAALSTLEAAKSQQTAPAAQGETKVKTAVTQELAAAPTTASISSTTVRISGLSSAQRSQGAPGMNMNQLNSMLQTSVKMLAIRNDASIPEEVKKKLLMPMEQENRNALNLANAKAEQEEKAKTLEASSEDAAAIRQAGEEIAASAEAKDTPTTTPADPTALANSNEVANATPPTPTPEAPSPTYSTSTPAPATSVGISVDTRA